MMRAFVVLIFSLVCAAVGDQQGSIEEYSSYEIVALQGFLNQEDDAKDFIDRPLLQPLESMKRDFRSLKDRMGVAGPLDLALMSRRFTEDPGYERRVRCEFEGFVDANFGKAGSELEKHRPEDFRENLPLSESVDDASVKNVLSGLNACWLEMSRFYKGGLEARSSAIVVPHPFFVPGGRFREMYYWDSYWILQGLLISGMHQSALNLVENFVSLIDRFGYVPNGTRKYYRNRTQPPLFSHMLVHMYMFGSRSGVKNTAYEERFRRLALGRGLEMAVREYRWLQENRTRAVRKGGVWYRMSVYNVETDFWRPESCSRDMKTASEGEGVDPCVVYSNIKTAAESGIDFSDRWQRESDSLSSICIRDVVPADLNAIMYRNEMNIGFLLRESGDSRAADGFFRHARLRAEAINKVLWNGQQQVWNDYNFKTGAHTDRRFYFSNMFPMLYGIKPPGGASVYWTMHRYSDVLFGYPGGVPASADLHAEDSATREQWDFPNVWAPYQSLFVNFLMGLGEKTLAVHVAKSFYENVRAGYETNGYFYEKYNCSALGRPGHGGEYRVPTGFGWTNGVMLDFIHRFWRRFVDPDREDMSLAGIKEYLAARAM